MLFTQIPSRSNAKIERQVYIDAPTKLEIKDNSVAKS